MHTTYSLASPLLKIRLIMLLLASCTLVIGFTTRAQSAHSLDQGFVQVVKEAQPAVVHIRVEKEMSRGGMQGKQFDEMFNNPFFERFFGPQQRQNPRGPNRQFKQQGQGSGFIISKDGYILTNNHVVEGADTINVILSDERKFTAELIGADPLSDVALIRIQDGGNLPTLPLGNSDDLEVGEWIIAIGNPFGLSQTVTVGVVSAKGRNSVGLNEYENFIQTDAAINPGNSGGPLLNIHGEAIGINSALFSRTGGYMGIGFAIPINMVKDIQSQLQSSGKVTRGWLGVVIQDVNKELAESLGLSSSSGILISDVQPDSPAAKAGIMQRDVLMKLNDAPLTDTADLRIRVARISPGSIAKLTLIRDGKTEDVDVTIGERPSQMSQAAQEQPPKNPLEEFGLAVQNLTPELAERFGYTEKQGVIVSQVEPGSPASAAGLRPGQLLEEVNQQRIENVEGLQRELAAAKDPKRVLLLVRGGNFSKYIVLVAQ